MLSRVLASSVATAAVLALVAGPAHAIEQNGRIAFSSDRGNPGHSDIYLMNANGHHVRRLTRSARRCAGPTCLGFSSYAPAYSPDGSKIAFTWLQTRGSPGQINQIDLRTHEETFIGGRPAGPGGGGFFQDDATYRPGGSGIAYDAGPTTRTGAVRDRDIYATSSVVRRRLAPLTSGAGDNSAPAYSPDGTKIAFVSTRDGDADIYEMNADGTGVHRLTRDRVREYAPAYSPNGRFIAFARRTRRNTEIFRMRLSDGRVDRLTHDRVGDFAPTYSPDGRFIAFEASHRGGLDIYTMRANGTHVRRLTNARGDAYPSWGAG